jgi:hypothetical protein
MVCNNMALLSEDDPGLCVEATLDEFRGATWESAFVA